MNQRFAMDQRVRIVSADPDYAPVRGQVGTVVGVADAGPLEYGVWLERDETVWQVPASGLEPA